MLQSKSYLKLNYFCELHKRNSKSLIRLSVSVILLWLKVRRVMFFIAHILDMSGSRAMMDLSEKSISAFGTLAASSSVFLIIFEVILVREMVCLSVTRCSVLLRAPPLTLQGCLKYGPSNFSKLVLILLFLFTTSNFIVSWWQLLFSVPTLYLSL